MEEDIHRLVKELKSPDEGVRRYAAEDLGYLGSDDAISALVKALSDQSASVREAVQDALISIGGEKVAKNVAPLLRSENTSVRNAASEIMQQLSIISIPVLSQMIKDKDKDVRKYAVDIIGMIKKEEGVDALISALDDTDVNVASGAAESLGLIKSKKAVKPLVNAIKKRNDVWFKSAAIRSLGFISDKEVSSLLKEQLKNKEPIILYSTIQAMGDAGDLSCAKDLIKFLTSDNKEFHKSAILALEKMFERTGDKYFKDFKQEISIEPLLVLLKEDKKDLLISTAKLLGRIKDEKAVKSLLPLLQCEDEDIRHTVFDVILDIKPKDLSIFFEYLRDENIDNNTKAEIIDLLGNIGDPKLAKNLYEFLEHEDPVLRRVSSRIFGILKDPDSKGLLIEKLVDNDDETRMHAARTLGILKSDKAVDRLSFLLKDENPDVRNAAANALLNIASDEVKDKMIYLLKSTKNVDVKCAAINILGKLKQEKVFDIILNAIDDPNPEIRKSASEAVINFSDKKDHYLNKFLKLIEDEEESIRITAVKNLALWDKEKILVPLLDLLKKEENPRVLYEIAIVLGKKKASEAVYELTNLLTSEHMLVRFAMIEALGEIGDDSAIAALEELLETTDMELYDAASNAMEKIRDKTM